MNHRKNKLIEENFFIIDSNNLEKIESHLYGFIISNKGILTDNYYKLLGKYEEPDPFGAYVMIRKISYEIRLDQDFYGSFGIYIYKNKDTDYFALSNSFLLLEEYLHTNQNLSFNKDFADNFIISELCTPSIYETMINEIEKLPSNIFLTINIENKKLNTYLIDYKENTIPLESEEGLKIIDKWVDKWGYIFRSLKHKTDNIFMDLSGGFDSRVVLSILINSGVDLNSILINSLTDKNHGHDEDFKIANNIASKFAFKINNFTLDNNCTIWGLKDNLFCSMYSKLGFHKEFYFRKGFFTKPRFGFTGGGGEIIRGVPSNPIKDYLKSISLLGRKIKGHEEEFFKSSIRLCNRSVIRLMQKKIYNNDKEVTLNFYSQGRARSHFGTLVVEGFLTNIYIIQPLMDPEIKRIKYDIIGNSTHDFIAFIYVRFARRLIDFPFQGQRKLNLESIKKAEILNNNLSHYEIKTDFNPNYFIDNSRKSPIPQEINNQKLEEYLKNLFKSSKFYRTINTIYDNKVYDWAIEYINKSNYFPLRHGYALLAIATTLEYLSKKNNK